MRAASLVFVAVAVPLSATACRKGAAPEPASSADAAPTESESPQWTYSGKARAFAEHLESAPIRHYSLDVAGDARLTYDELRFSRDDRFTATASLRLADEPYACKESGTFRIDLESVSGADLGRIDLTVDRTDCPGRKPGEQWRIEVRYTGDDAEVVKR